MSIKNCIRKATQYNCCLDRNIHGTKFQKCSTLSATVKNAANVKNAKNTQNVSADNFFIYIFSYINLLIYGKIYLKNRRKRCLHQNL